MEKNAIVLDFGGGRTYAAKLGIGMLEMYTKAENKSLPDLFKEFEKDAFFAIPRLMTAAINYKLQRDGQPLISLDDVYDLIDEVGFNSGPVAQFSEAFAKFTEVAFTQQPAEGKPKAAKK